MKLSLGKIFLCFGLLCTAANAANILVVLPMPARSHSNIVSSLAKELAVRGHNVTFVTFFPEKNPPDNLIQVELSTESFESGIPTNLQIYFILDRLYVLLCRNDARQCLTVLQNKNFWFLLNTPRNLQRTLQFVNLIKD